MIEAAKNVSKEKILVNAADGLSERFFKYVQKEGPIPDGAKPHYVGLGNCWFWTSAKNKHGYGEFSVNKSVFKAHRVAWFLTHGSIPDGVFVCHKCDFTSCVNPAHLFIGGHKENTRDCVEKGRKRGGEDHWKAKLTAAQVVDIRSRYAAGGVAQKDLALEFGVLRPVISNIIHRRLWKRL